MYSVSETNPYFRQQKNSIISLLLLGIENLNSFTN